MKKILLLAGAALCLATGAHAPRLFPSWTSITPDGSNFLYSYHATFVRGIRA